MDTKEPTERVAALEELLEQAQVSCCDNKPTIPTRSSLCFSCTGADCLFGGAESAGPGLGTRTATTDGL
jgi:hypothetical protein